MNRVEAEKVLYRKFGIRHFYDTQWEVVEKLLAGQRVLLIEKTGFGKSLCFQFPAVVFEGVTVVFSPLIALMRDQCRKLSRLGISACCINSEQTKKENEAILEDGDLKYYRLLKEYVPADSWKIFLETLVRQISQSYG